MKIYERLKRGLKAAADLMLPRVCVVCGERLLMNENFICLHCIADMPMTHFWQQRSNPMADKFNAIIQCGLEKEWELPRNPHEKYAFAAALFFYSHEADYRNILYNIKYKGRTDVGRYFGQMLGAKLAGSAEFKNVDCVIPVPLHWARRWKRGYNQAEIIAREVADALGAPLTCDILYRRRKTRTQTKLDIKGKAENVAGAFGIKDQHDHAQKNIRHILLIDDVFTTGATVGECFRALRTVFPPDVRISVATLGFVGRA